ncbi:isochorismatase [Myxosarcina sp. GI1]|uniref:isochorismatase n=1 Tax=Myxosarcina sp. GI1 TaxID=1541065 RepID=UPI0005697832|nr:isochorismatase [Myxosarcina sp. GI1]
MNNRVQLPIPEFFDPSTVGEVWQIPYQKLTTEAKNWAQQHQLQSANEDSIKVGLLAIDVQNTFCLPGYELFVGGKSGTGAVDDNRRLCEFIYRNLGVISEIMVTMDTHNAMQIFHPLFWIDESGQQPPPMTEISVEDVEKGVWQVNPAVAPYISNEDYNWLQDYTKHYVRKLNLYSKYPLIIWPYHAILGGSGHTLVSAVESACFFHSFARESKTHFELKGSNPLTENYSVLSPEVLEAHDGKAIAQKNTAFIDKLLSFDLLIITGQAKSHCVAWTIDDLLAEIQARDPKLAKKVYLLEDCTSPVVVPGGADFSDRADAAFDRFAAAGMNRVTSQEAVMDWI